MTLVIRWLLPVILGALGRVVAGVFEGSCPLSAQTFVCGHWEAVCTVAGVILGAFGVTVTRKKASDVAVSRAALRVVSPPKPEPEPSRTLSDGGSAGDVNLPPGASNLDQTPVTLDDPSACGG